MENADRFSCTELYVTRFIAVITNSMQPNRRLVPVKGRHSDAYIFILEGSCTYEFDSEQFTVHAGDILYLACNSSYKMTLGDGIYRFIYVDFEFHRPENTELTSFVCTPYSAAEAENLFRRMLRMSSSHSKERFAACMACIYSISSLIAASRDKGYFGAGIRQKLGEAKLWMEQNAFDPMMTVAEAAAHCQISDAYFRRNFKLIYHISPARFIMTLRIEKAKKLLSYPFVTLSECAAQCGFSSVQYFVRVFKKNTGTTPSQFRKSKAL